MVQSSIAGSLRELLRVIHTWTISRLCVSVTAQVLMLLLLNQLLLQLKLSDILGTLFLSEALLLLMVSPYLSSRALATQWHICTSEEPLLPSTMPSASTFSAILIGAQIPLIIFVVLSTLAFSVFVPSLIDVQNATMFFLAVTLFVCILLGASIGALGWRIFYHQVFAVEFAYFIILVLIGSVFLLSPLNRWLDSLLIAGRFSIISAFLSINPLIALCHLLEIDIFRTPYLYKLTPIPSHLFIYPKWYAVCACQASICFLCLGAAFRIHLKPS